MRAAGLRGANLGVNPESSVTTRPVAAAGEERDCDQDGDRERDGGEHLHPAGRARRRYALAIRARPWVRWGGRVRHEKPFVGI